MTVRPGIVCALIVGAVLLWPDALAAHGVARGDARFLQSLQGAAIAPLMYLGAKHMITGYDHLLFLVGVIFFLYRMRTPVKAPPATDRPGGRSPALPSATPAAPG